MALNKQTFILLVEDDEQLRSTLARGLRATGYLVFEAGTFKEAIHQLQIKPHLLLLDINLPDASGWDVAEWLKDLSIKIPVVIISGVSQNMKSLERFKPQAFLAKPFTMGALLSVVNQYTPH